MKTLIKVKAIQSLFIGEGYQSLITKGREYIVESYDDKFLIIRDDRYISSIYFRRMFESVYDTDCYYCKDGVYYDVLGTSCKYNFCPICGEKLK